MQDWRPADGAAARERWRELVALGWPLLPAPLAAVAAAIAAGLAWWPTALLAGLVTLAVLAAFGAAPERRRFGLANGTTLLRLNLAAFLVAASWAELQGTGGSGLAWPVFAVALLALLLDGADGWLARRLGEASAFGERFDMLSDTAFTAVACLCLVAFAATGPWVLAVALLRPLFVAAGQIWPRLAAPLPASRRRKAFCGGVLLLLVAGLAPPLHGMAPSLAAIGLVLLALSFASDIVLLLVRPRSA